MQFDSSKAKLVAAKLLLLIFVLVTIFHVLVLTGLLPFTIVWGGRLQSREQMIVFELISLTLNSFFIWIALIQNGFFQKAVPPKVVRILLWIMSALFSLNTIGNLLAESSLETRIFTPITFLLAILCAFLAKNRED
ncbi:hypothetical protein EHQ05_16135 [Leptospira yasudae]|uniref:hypothetical protein n=1 Tax=Leptospira yasudae TaxID=2202201 RepID=UPI00108319DB|nr:hypothetical protein [Leptospira yasudae]TGK24448.1 hypothetical protein EHQ05_16135 [Leptospira yasudae]TGM05766.1 hypothetical protein EHQ86_10090 [Leptospira yasudae]